MNRRICNAVALVLSIGMGTAALAGPPFITDDPEPVDVGHGEFYIASIDTHTHDETVGTLPHVEFNYGPIENVQLHLIAPMTYDATTHPHDFNYGYGDTELGVKYRFVKEDSLFPGCPQIGTFPLVEVPTGDARLGLGNGKAQEFVPIWLQKSFGPKEHEWTVYGGGGYWFNPGEGNKDFTFTGVVLQNQVTDKLMLGGELLYSTSAAEGEDPHFGFNLGGVYDLNDHWHLLFSAGRDFKGDNLLTAYVAVLLTF